MRAVVRFFALVVFAFSLWAPSTAQTPAAPEPPQAASTAPAAPAGPAQVKIGLYINDIQAIDLHNYSFVADVYVWFRDSDPGIVPGNTFECQLTM